MTVEELKAELEEWPNNLPVMLELQGQQGFLERVEYSVHFSDQTNKRLILTDYAAD